MCQRIVLIVEDELLIRMTLAAVLLDAGYQVIEAGNVLEAVAGLGRYQFDAVTTDIDMPGGLNRLDLARMVVTMHSNVGVIVASGGDDLTDHELPGSARFVRKPYQFDAIVDMLRNMAPDEGLRLAG